MALNMEGSKKSQERSVAVIGGGPIGSAAASASNERGVWVKVYEIGPQVGANIRDWGHVHVFTPWRYCAAEKVAGKAGCGCEACT